MHLDCYVYVYLLFVYVFLLSCMCLCSVPLCCFLYCFVCKCVPPGLNPTAVNKTYQYISLTNLAHQGYECPVGYEISSPVDWYRQGVWQICANVTEAYAASFVRALCCPRDDVPKFPLNVSTCLLGYKVSHFTTR